MSKPKGGLGSRFNALLPDEAQPGIREVLIERVRPNPCQPRTSFDESALEELAASIREHGLIQTPRRAGTTTPKPAPSADDREIARAIERVLQTPGTLQRSDKELRVTIAFHTDEKLQAFFDMLGGIRLYWK